MIFTEEIKLEDGVTPVARAAQHALAELTGSLKVAREGLHELGEIDAVKKKSDVQDTVGKHLGGLDGDKKKTDDIAKPQRDMWADASHAADVGKQSIGVAIEGVKAAFASLAQGDVKGAVSGLTDSLAGMAQMLDLIMPGLGQVVGTIIKIAGGLVGITAGLIQSGMEFAVVSTQAKQQMLTMFDAMGDGVTTGEQADEMLSALADRIGISKDKLAGFTKEFLQMGVASVEQLERLTLAAETANAFVGAGGAAAFTNLQKKIQLAAETGGQIKLDPKFLKMINQSGAKIEDLKKAFPELGDNIKGATVDAAKLGAALTEAVIERGAKSLDRLSNSFGEIKAKFMQDLGDMFEDMSDVVDPFMKEVKDLFKIFGASEESGKALKAGIMAFFKETFTLAAKLVPMVKHFLLDLIIYGLQAYIALKPIVAKVKEFLASAEGMAIVNGLLTAGKYALMGLAVAVGLVVGLFTIMAVACVTVGLAIWGIIGYAISLGATVAGALASAVTWIINALIGLGVSINTELGGWPVRAVEAAYNFIMGIVTGIQQGAGLVYDAVKGLAGGAVKAFTSVLGIESPSKVMMELGGHTGTGFAMGLGDAANDVYGVASSVAGNAVLGASSGQQSGSAGGGGNVFHINVNAAEGQDAKEIAEEVWSLVAERMALASGG